MTMQGIKSRCNQGYNQYRVVILTKLVGKYGSKHRSYYLSEM